MLIVRWNYSAYSTVYTVITFLKIVTVNLGTNDISFRHMFSSIYRSNDPYLCQLSS